MDCSEITPYIKELAALLDTRYIFFMVASIKMY